MSAPLCWPGWRCGRPRRARRRRCGPWRCDPAAQHGQDRTPSHGDELIGAMRLSSVMPRAPQARRGHASAGGAFSACIGSVKCWMVRSTGLADAGVWRPPPALRSDSGPLAGPFDCLGFWAAVAPSNRSPTCDRAPRCHMRPRRRKRFRLRRPKLRAPAGLLSRGGHFVYRTGWPCRRNREPSDGPHAAWPEGHDADRTAAPMAGREEAGTTAKRQAGGAADAARRRASQPRADEARRLPPRPWRSRRADALAIPQPDRAAL